MNTSTIVFMVLTQTIITVITFSFLFLAMRAKEHSEPDSYTDNDDET